MICQRCKKEVSGDDVNYINASEYVCGNCYLATKGEAREAPEPVNKYDISPKTKQEYTCKKCGFVTKFVPNSEANKKCTYCGEADLTPKGGRAAELLAEDDLLDTEE